MTAFDLIVWSLAVGVSIMILTVPIALLAFALNLARGKL